MLKFKVNEGIYNYDTYLETMWSNVIIAELYITLHIICCISVFVWERYYTLHFAYLDSPL